MHLVTMVKEIVEGQEISNLNSRSAREAQDATFNIRDCDAGCLKDDIKLDFMFPTKSIYKQNNSSIDIFDTSMYA